MVAADDDPETITVVTSDERLIERVTELGARISSSGSFRRRLDRTAPPGT